MTTRFSLLTAALLLSTPTFAMSGVDAVADDDIIEEPAEEAPVVRYEQRQVIDEDAWQALEVEGQLVRPDGVIITTRPIETFNPLIRLRMDFNLEMQESVSAIQ